jgi:hypothetical protein
VNVNVVELGIPQKVEVAKAALFSDYLSLLKVDVAAKPTGEYPMIEPISLMAIKAQPNQTELLKWELLTLLLKEL